MRVFVAIILIAAVLGQKLVSDEEFNAKKLLVDLDCSDKNFSPYKEFICTVTMENNGDETVAFYNVATPFDDEGVRDDFFDTNPETSEYLGVAIAMSGVPAKPEDVILLRPDQVLKRDFDLSQLMQFKQVRKYRVRVSWNLIWFPVESEEQLNDAGANGLLTLKNAHQHFLASDWESVHVKETYMLPMHEEELNSRLMVDGKNHYIGTTAFPCKGDQEASVRAALENASKWTKNGYKLAQQDPKWMTYWFGNQGAEQMAKLKTLRDSYGTYEFRLNCWGEWCQDNVFAYVFPSDREHNIYLCGQYYKGRADRGFDSQPGTVIHETSHFADVIGTKDMIYGLQAVKDLAKSDPAKAAKNADTNEYYQENEYVDWSKYQM